MATNGQEGNGGNGNGWRRWGSMAGLLLLLLTFIGYIYQAGQVEARLNDHLTRVEYDLQQQQHRMETDYVRVDVLTPKLEAIQDTLREVKENQKQLNELIQEQRRNRRGPG